MVEDLFGVAGDLVFGQDVDVLDAVGECGVRSFDFDGVAVVQGADVVEDSAAVVADGVPD